MKAAAYWGSPARRSGRGRVCRHSRGVWRGRTTAETCGRPPRFALPWGLAPDWVCRRSPAAQALRKGGRDPRPFTVWGQLHLLGLRPRQANTSSPAGTHAGPGAQGAHVPFSGITNCNAASFSAASLRPRPACPTRGIVKVESCPRQARGDEYPSSRDRLPLGGPRLSPELPLCCTSPSEWLRGSQPWSSPSGPPESLSPSAQPITGCGG